MTALLTISAPAGAATVKIDRDEATGWDVVTLTAGDTIARCVPAAGCNVFSIVSDGVEYFRTPDKLADLPGFGHGNPVIYPMPNRVRDGKFVYDGKTYEFPPNNGPNFLHGLVHSVPWKITGLDADGRAAVLRCAYDFAEGTEALRLFPFPHVVRLEIRVAEGSVRWTYTVDNSAGEAPVPYGMCFHPYFLYQGARANTYLQVPATHLMESVELLPTGELLELEGTKYDAREPVSVEGLVLDDVYYGMRPDAPAVIDFREAGRRVELYASEDFSHLVVYTPEGQPFLCVENQTCSTDAHNLDSQGKKEAASLRLCPPGETQSGWAEYRFAADAE